jgi:hypothetical protein
MDQASLAKSENTDTLSGSLPVEQVNASGSLSQKAY